MKNIIKRFPMVCLALILMAGLALSAQTAQAAKQIVVGTASVLNTGTDTERTKDLSITLKGGFNDVNGLAFTLLYDKAVFEFLGLVQNTTPIDNGATYDPGNPPSAATVGSTLYYQANNRPDVGKVMIAAAGANFFATGDVVPFLARFRVKAGAGSGTYPIKLQQTIIGPDTAASAGYTVPTPIPYATGLAPTADPTTAASFPVTLGTTFVPGSITVTGGYSINALVQYEGGAQANGALVRLRKGTGELVEEKPVTSGAFNFINKPNGDYKIIVIANNPGFQTRYEGPVFTVSGSSVTRPTITLLAYSPISGKILVNGAAIPGVKAKVMSGTTLIGTFPVDGNGNFVTIPVDPSGTYTITAVYGSAEVAAVFTDGQFNWVLGLGTLSGTISGLESGQNVMVHIVSATAQLEKTLSKTGDGNDVSYQFLNLLPATDYIVSVVGDGIPVTYYDSVTDIASATTRSVTANLDTSGVNFTFDAPTVAIAGKITEGSVDVADVPVFAEETTTSAIQVMTSGETGDYTLNVAAGTYIVYAYKTNGKTFYYNSTETTQVDTDATDVTPPASGINIKLDEDTCMIKGQVTYRREGGDPVDGIMVRGVGPKGDGVYVTDESGNYSLYGLSCGDTYEVTISPDSPYPPQSKSATASEAGATLNFVIQTGWTLSGTVTEQGTATAIMGAWVYLLDSNGVIQGVLAVTNASGQFTLADIPAGVYTLMAEHQNYQVKEETNLAVEEDISGRSVTMTKGVSIAGTVTDATTTNAISGVMVIATAVGEEARYGVTGADGKYTLTGLIDAKQYFLIFTKLGYLKKVVLVTAPQAAYDVQLQTPAAKHNLSGTVVLSGGTPIQDAYVVVSSATNKFYAATTTIAGGAFSLTDLVGASDYKIVVIPGGNRPVYIEENFNLNANVTGKVITIPVGSISGTVTLSDAAAGKEVVVYLLDETGNYVTDVTATGGTGGVYNYLFESVQAATNFKIVGYCIGYGLNGLTWYDNTTSFAAAANVQAGATANITLTKQ